MHCSFVVHGCQTEADCERHALATLARFSPERTRWALDVRAEPELQSGDGTFLSWQATVYAKALPDADPESRDD